METFSRPDYYPTPSDNVITYNETVVSKQKKSVLKADLVALIVDLSSPVDAVDYTVISDFFLVYRNFISSMQLSDFLIMRFRWCMNEILLHDSIDTDKRKIGEIALVRTFVLLRHWILNYFVQDFLSDMNLRLRVIKFLNEPCVTHLRIIKSTTVNLKKAWIHCSKLMWTNISLDEPDFIGQDEKWLGYEIKDITQLDNIKKRDSQLSYLARQGASSPYFRNQSVLSLFKSSDIFKLPNSGDKSLNKTQRTASMVLFPCDNSNSKTEQDITLEDDAVIANPDITSGKDTFHEHERKISHLSKMTNVSSIIKDIKYPISPSIDKVIPPTPARNVEFILKLPEDTQGENSSAVVNDENSKFDPCGGRTSSNVHSTVVQPIKHRGAIGLLAKWKNNHSSLKIRQKNTTAKTPNNGYSKPEMDNFVKYVISITPLENRAKETEELSNLVSSKYDILSARTIEEVEYLVSLENELVEKVNEKNVSEPMLSSLALKDAKHNKVESTVPLNFSAMDNLNLYQTVSSIADSVISLSNTLAKSRQPQVQSKQQNTLSPSFAALERRRVQSSIATVMRSNTRFSLISQVNDKEALAGTDNNGPQRLVFHDDSLSGRYRQLDGISSSDPTLAFSPSKVARPQSSGRTSPLKQVLDNFTRHSVSTNGQNQMDNDSLISSVSYDSQFSNSLQRRSIVPSQTLAATDQYAYSLKRKDAQNNLREFTFENENGLVHEESSSLTSFVTTRESEHEDELLSMSKVFASKVVRPASGRISLIRKQSLILDTRETYMKSTVQAVTEDLDFLQKDRELLQREIELEQLEKDVAKRASNTISVSTNVLFNSKNNSPKKVAHDNDLGVGLEKTPSIEAFLVKNSSSKNLHETSNEGPKSRKQNLQESYSGTLNHQISSDSSFNYLEIRDPDPSTDNEMSAVAKSKYLFSPGSGSVDIASPAKNVEELKDKFLKKEEEYEDDVEASIEEEKSCRNEVITTAEKHIAEIRPRTLNQANVVDIANLPDDSVHDDPVNVALMKLEGTYKRNDGENDESKESPTASVLADEVDMLDIPELSVPHMSPSDKRKSLLIERRRQTIMNIPYTPDSQEELFLTNDDQHTRLIKVRELLNSYEIRDPMLLVENCAQHVPFILMYDSLSIAQQMTLIEKELLAEVDWNELLDLRLTYAAPQVTSWLQLLVQNETLSGIDLAIARFNLTVDWIISEIILTSDVKLKRNTIQRFIHVADHCRTFQNYNTMMEIVLALSSIVVQKFSEAWRLIEPGDLVTWEELKQIPSLDRNYSSVRKLLNSVDPTKGCVPFIVVYLSDISLNSEKKNWFVENQVVNYNKFETNVQIVKNFIQRVQWSKFYKFRVDHELLSKCVYLTALSPDEIAQLTRGISR